MPLDWPERQGRWTRLAHGPDDAPMSARGHIAARASICLLHLARCKKLLVLDDHDTHAVLAAGIRPDARQDVVDRVNNVAITIIADRPVGTLRGVAHEWHRRVDAQ